MGIERNLPENRRAEIDRLKGAIANYQLAHELLNRTRDAALAAARTGDRESLIPKFNDLFVHLDYQAMMAERSVAWLEESLRGCKQ